MRVFLGLGKLVALLFWALVLVNLFSPFAKPFGLLLQLAGGLTLLAHVAELWLFKQRLHGLPHAGLQRLQVLLFGIFHLLGLPPRTVEEREHA